MKYILINSFFIFIFSGCAISSVSYNGEKDMSRINQQYFEHHECTHLLGPYNIGNDLVIDDIIKNTVEKANEHGLFGNKLINIKIQEGGYTMLLFSRLCIYVSGNVVYSADVYE